MRIKKTSQTTILPAQAVNTYSESTEDAYACDYINKLRTYSTEEKVVGTWVNGKPLYGKTIIFENINLKNDQRQLSIGVSDAYIRFIKDGMFTMNSGYRFPLNTSWQTLQLVSTIVSNDNKSILIWCNDTNTISSLTIYVEYTKTTD